MAVPTDDILISGVKRTRASHMDTRIQAFAKQYTTAFNQSYIPQTILQWNELPANAAESPTLELFKQHISIDRLVTNAHTRTSIVIGVIVLMDIYRLMNRYRYAYYEKEVDVLRSRRPTQIIKT